MEPIIDLPDSIESGGTQYIKLTSHPLASVLGNSGIQEISHTFPRGLRIDSIVYNERNQPVVRPNLHGSYRILMPDKNSRDALISALRGRPGVLDAHPPIEVTTDSRVPDDPYFDQQWGLQNTGQFGGVPDVDIDAPEAWDFGYGGDSVIIAIMDEGVLATHEDLAPRVFGDVGSGYHGTHVAGICAATTNNGVGVAGVEGNARIMNKVIPLGDLEGVVVKIYEAIEQGADVLNNSWGHVNENTPDFDELRSTMYAYKMNRVFVASKGNEGWGAGTYHHPSDYLYAFGVGNLTNSNQRATNSNWGNGIDVMAPGTDVLSALDFDDSSYGFLSGTSMAAPFVSGLAALLKSHRSDLYNDDIYWLMRYSAVDIDVFPSSPGYDDETGWGRINAYNAIRMLHSPYQFYQLSNAGGFVHSTDAWDTYPFWDTPGLPDGMKLAKRYEVRANVTFPETFPDTVFAWGRGVATLGYHFSHRFGQGWCEVVSGSLTSTGCQLRTSVYEVKTITGETIGFFPCEPQQVHFAYSVVGIPESPGCCIEIRGNVDGDPAESIDVADLTYMDNFMFKGGPPPACFEEGNVNGSGGIDITDLTYLVSYMFRNGPPPVPCP